MPLFRSLLSSLSKSGSAKLKGDVTLSEGSNVTLTQSGQDISIASAAGGGTIATTTAPLTGDNAGNAIAAGVPLTSLSAFAQSILATTDFDLFFQNSTATPVSIWNENGGSIDACLIGFLDTAGNGGTPLNIQSYSDAGNVDVSGLHLDGVQISTDLLSGINATQLTGIHITGVTAEAGATAAAAIGLLISDISSATNNYAIKTGKGQIYFGGGAGKASGASVTLDEIAVPAATNTISGTTQITTAKGFNKFSIYKPTYTDSSAITIDRGATLYIEDAPAAAGSVTLTNKYAIWIDNGVARLDGGIKTTEAAPTAGKILKSDGTSFVDSAETYAAPGTSGNVLTSDGTNWTSAAPAAQSPLATTGTAASPTATQTDTITHGLGRTPTIIRLYGIGTFTANSSATPTTHSMGVWSSSSGNRCIYQGYNTAAITTTQAAAVSSVFSIRLDTGANSFITGIIQNVGATTFQIAWTETGTSSAQNYMWEAQ